MDENYKKNRSLYLLSSRGRVKEINEKVKNIIATDFFPSAYSDKISCVNLISYFIDK
jgi:hypothetical protein